MLAAGYTRVECRERPGLGICTEQPLACGQGASPQGGMRFSKRESTEKGKLQGLSLEMLRERKWTGKEWREGPGRQE